jgi:hypothetical protein
LPLAATCPNPLSKEIKASLHRKTSHPAQYNLLQELNIYLYNSEITYSSLSTTKYLKKE